jgi:hypothetical protein
MPYTNCYELQQSALAFGKEDLQVFSFFNKERKEGTSSISEVGQRNSSHTGEFAGIRDKSFTREHPNTDAEASTGLRCPLISISSSVAAAYRYSTPFPMYLLTYLFISTATVNNPLHLPTRPDIVTLRTVGMSLTDSQDDPILFLQLNCTT